jgi:geranylgeranyl reductase family protein
VTTDWDLIVVGAGPAGSAAAIAALTERPGARVLLLDRAPLGRDKVCGDGIAPHTVAALEALGVRAVEPPEVVPTVRLSAPGGGSSSAATGDPGYVVPRAQFDERLARAAIERGAVFEERRVASVAQDAEGVSVDGRDRAPALIAADGANSVVRRAIGQGHNSKRALAVAVRGYAPTPAGMPRELEIRWDSRRSGGLCYAWSFPTAEGTSNVGYGMSSAALTNGRAELEQRMRLLLAEFDFDGVALSGHTLPLSIDRPKPAVGRVLLTGDAASLINPLTGEGIYSAVASGIMAGRAAATDAAGAGARYGRELAAAFGRQHRQLKLVYPLVDSRAVLDAVIRACNADRGTFDRLLDVGLGESAFRMRDMATLAKFLARRGLAVN